MNATGKRRLLKLADFLETADIPGKFDMSEWGKAGTVESGMPTCKTAACAFGWATMIPSFRRAGLSMDEHGLPTFDGRRSWAAAIEFFGITLEQEEALFEPPDLFSLKGKRGRKIVAQRIRAFVVSNPA